MIFILFIYAHDLQQELFDSMLCKIMHFSLSASCVRMMIYDYFIRLQVSLPTRICIQFDCNMKKHLYLSLDFNEIFPHSTSRISRLND